MITVGIIEDDLFVRTELARMLTTSELLTTVFAVESAEEYFSEIQGTTKIDILLLDIGLPGMSGIEAIPKIMTSVPDLKIIILTSFRDNDHIFKALKAGASGYLIKSTKLDGIENTLLGLKKGIPALSPAIARRMIDYFNQSSKKNAIDHKLTNREFDVLRCLLDGLSYKLIADNLNLSINSIRYHIKNIYRKLHIHSRPELMKMYLDGEFGDPLELI